MKIEIDLTSQASSGGTAGKRVKEKPSQTAQLKSILRRINTILSSHYLHLKRRESETVSVGAGPYFQQRSGKVDLVNNFVHIGAYNSRLTFNTALKVGTGIKGDNALEEVQKIFDFIAKVLGNKKEFPDAVIDFDRSEYNMWITLPERKEKILVKCNYASAFCFVGVRVTI